MSYRPQSKPTNRTTAQQIRKRDNHTCHQCGQPAHQVDHKTPRAEGGTDHPTNLQLLCNTCHHHKTRTERQRGIQRRKQRRQLPQHPHPGQTTPPPGGHPTTPNTQTPDPT